MVSVVERSSSGSFDEVIGTVGTDDFGLVLGIALGIVAVALLVNFIMTILIWNPLEVGCKKLFGTLFQFSPCPHIQFPPLQTTHMQISHI